MRRSVFTCLLRLVACVGALSAATAPAQENQFDVDLRDREIVRQFYRAVFLGADATNSGWTGSYAGPGNQGTTSAAFKDAVRTRVNFYREMAGVPSWITFDNSLSAKAQAAAFMMSGANLLTHYPYDTYGAGQFRFPSVDGDVAAENSNLALGSQGPKAIEGYIRDTDSPGYLNTEVGHRVWVLHPPTKVMGTGDVPGQNGFTFPADGRLGAGTSPRAANALWIVDDDIGQAYPPIGSNQSFLAFPAPGYIPHRLLPARWSLHVENAFAPASYVDYTGAQVTMTKNGVPIPVAIDFAPDPDSPSYFVFGHLVWVPENFDRTSPGPIMDAPVSDIVYTVSVTNVLVNNVPRSFSYTVTVFDDAVRSPGVGQPRVLGNTIVQRSQASFFRLFSYPFADGFAWRAIESGPTGGPYGASSLTDFTASVYQGSPVLNENGNFVFKFGHVNPVTDQLLTYTKVLIPRSTGKMSFRTRLGSATPNQVALVQARVSGGNWTTLFRQAGTGPAGEATFKTVTVDLAPYASQTVEVRFNYTVEGTGTISYYPGFNSSFGESVGYAWAVDDIAFTDVDTWVAASPQIPDADGLILYQPTGNTYLQFRATGFGGYPLDFPTDWSPLHRVTVQDSPAPIQIARGVWSADPHLGVLLGGPGSLAISPSMGLVHLGQNPNVFSQHLGWLHVLPRTTADGLVAYTARFGWIYLPDNGGGSFLDLAESGQPAVWRHLMFVGPN